MGSTTCAMYIDSDSVPLWMIERVLTRTRGSFGDDLRVQAFKDWTNPWNRPLMEALWALDVDLVNVVPHAALKNGTDVAIAVTAVDALVRDPTDIVALASNDGDFTFLVRHLQRRGVTVMGFGLLDASAALAEACDEYVRYDTVTRSEFDPTRPTTPVDELIAAAVTRCVDEDGWAAVGRVAGVALTESGLRARDTGARTWSRYFVASKAFDAVRGPDGQFLVRPHPSAVP